MPTIIYPEPQHVTHDVIAEMWNTLQNRSPAAERKRFLYLLETYGERYETDVVGDTITTSYCIAPEKEVLWFIVSRYFANTRIDIRSGLKLLVIQPG